MVCDGAVIEDRISSTGIRNAAVDVHGRVLTSLRMPYNGSTTRYPKQLK